VFSEFGTRSFSESSDFEGFSAEWPYSSAPIGRFVIARAIGFKKLWQTLWPPHLVDLTLELARKKRDFCRKEEDLLKIVTERDKKINGRQL